MPPSYPRRRPGFTSGQVALSQRFVDDVTVERDTLHERLAGVVPLEAEGVLPEGQHADDEGPCMVAADEPGVVQDLEPVPVGDPVQLLAGQVEVPLEVVGR